jgi:hypothetical protein
MDSETATNQFLLRGRPNQAPGGGHNALSWHLIGIHAEEAGLLQQDHPLRF